VLRSQPSYRGDGQGPQSLDGRCGTAWAAAFFDWWRRPLAAVSGVPPLPPARRSYRRHTAMPGLASKSRAEAAP